MTLSSYRARILPSAISISLIGLFLSIFILQPAFSAPFTFSRQYKNKFERIKLSGQFEAEDQDGNGEISAQEVEDFSGIIIYRHLKQSQKFALFDVIELGEKIEFEEFKYDLATKELKFSVRTLEHPVNSLIETVDSYWHVNFQGQFDLFLTPHNGIVAIDPKQTGIAKITYNLPPGLDGMAILLILGLILIRINQQIQNELEFDQETSSSESW